jgi:hypothetical protein
VPDLARTLIFGAFSETWRPSASQVPIRSTQRPSRLRGDYFTFGSGLQARGGRPAEHPRPRRRQRPVDQRGHVSSRIGSNSASVRVAPVQAGRHQARPPGPRQHLLSLPYRLQQGRGPWEPDGCGNQPPIVGSLPQPSAPKALSPPDLCGMSVTCAARPPARPGQLANVTPPSVR